jgi:hypothetical protein
VRGKKRRSRLTDQDSAHASNPSSDERLDPPRSSLLLLDKLDGAVDDRVLDVFDVLLHILHCVDEVGEEWWYDGQRRDRVLGETERRPARAKPGLIQGPVKTRRDLIT